MPRPVLLMLSHSIEEWQQLSLLTDLGYDAWSLGGYIDPERPHSDLRPPLPHAARHPDLKAAVDALGTPDNLTAAQSHIPDAVLDWLGDDGVICLHHKEERLWGDWPRLLDWKRGSAGRRIIWRTVGQSVENNERSATPYRMAGCERVAYSPREAAIPGYSGHDALISFWAEPAAEPWAGTTREVIQVSQHLRQRDPFTNWTYWDSATRDLPRRAIGPGSEVIGGPGKVSHADMRAALRDSRAFLFTGSQPASYTLGLLEAMTAGIPTVSIGASWMRVFPYGPDLFEGHEIAPLTFDDPNGAFHALRRLLRDDDHAAEVSRQTRERAAAPFARGAPPAQWEG